MVNAGRVLIIPKGAWTNLTPYEMLDLVSEGDKAYLARQASVGVRPSEDASMTYWQPFGSSASIATTDTPGLVMPDGVTITVDATGLIVASLNVSDLKDIKITNLANGDVLKYDGTQSKWVNVALGTAASRNATASITSGSTDLIESGAVDSLKQTLDNKTYKTNDSIESTMEDTDYLPFYDVSASATKRILASNLAGGKQAMQMIAPIESSLVASQPYAIGDQFVYNGLLYTVTAAISQGGTITIDGNCTLSSKVCAQIKQLKSLLKIKTKQVSFNSSGIGSISDSDIHSTDKILAVANTADRGYAVGVIIGLGNTSNGAVTLYAIKQSGGAYTGNINVNYLIFPAG